MILLTGMVAAFWLPTIDFYFRGLDEMEDFTAFSKGTILGDQLSIIMKPNAQHFIPVYKAFLLLQWKLFGIS